MTKSVLCVYAHPDDCVLACGGSIMKHTANGDTVAILVMSHGSRTGTKEDIARKTEMEKSAAAVLGVTDVTVIQFADQCMDTARRSDIIKVIETHIERLKPSIVYTHFYGDANLDHRIVSDAVNVACRPTPGHCVKTLLMGEVVSSTEWGGRFFPTWFVDISEFFSKKMDALECYKEEMMRVPHARSASNVLDVSSVRGASLGVMAAEAFVPRRHVC